MYIPRSAVTWYGVRGLQGKGTFVRNQNFCIQKNKTTDEHYLQVRLLALRGIFSAVALRPHLESEGSRAFVFVSAGFLFPIKNGLKTHRIKLGIRRGMDPPCDRTRVLFAHRSGSPCCALPRRTLGTPTIGRSCCGTTARWSKSMVCIGARSWRTKIWSSTRRSIPTG